MIIRKTRNIVFLVANTLLRYPIWALLLILRPFKLFHYLFLVYPGNDYDLGGYCPKWLANSRLFWGKPTFGGIITPGRTGARGLILVIPNTAKQMLHDKVTTSLIVKRLERMAAILGIGSIATAGQLPSIIQKHGISVSDRLVDGKLGTIYTIEETLKAAIDEKGVVENPVIAIIGTGFIGNALHDNLVRQGKKVLGFNINSKVEDIRDADIIIVLTPRGKDFIPYIPHIKDGAIIIDDTHPRIFARIPNASLFKVAMSLEGVKFVPKLPGYHNKWVPGCAIEAILQAHFGKSQLTDPEHTAEAAVKLGLKPLLVR